MPDWRDRANRAAAWTGEQLGRAAAWVGDLTAGDLLPPELDAEHLEEQLAALVRRDELLYAAEARRLERALPDATPAERMEHLFRPILRRAMTVHVGGAAVELVPLSFLLEGSLRRRQTRTLVGRQIELIAVSALLFDWSLTAADLGEEVILALDRVYGLDRLREDLRGPGPAGDLRAAGAREVARKATRLVLRGVGAWLEAGRSILDAYAGYCRFADLQAYLLKRFRTVPRDG